MLERSEKAERVLKIIEQFVIDQRISCDETIYQSDRVIVNAYDLMYELINVAGYMEIEEEDD